MIERYQDYITLSKRQQIVEASHAILRYGGVKQFTMEMVAQYLGIAKGTIYNHFENKDELLAELASNTLEQLHASWGKIVSKDLGGLEKLRQLLLSCYDFYIRFPKYFELILFLERPEFSGNSNIYRAAEEKLANRFVRFFRSQQQEGNVRAELNPVQTFYIIRGSFSGFLNLLQSKEKHEKNKEHFKEKVLMESFVGIVIDGIKA